MHLQEPEIPGFFTLPQMQFLHDIVHGRKPMISVEIGSYMGRSTYAICKALDSLGGARRLICVDSWAQQVDEQYFKSKTMVRLFRRFPQSRKEYARPDAQSVMDFFIHTMNRYAFMKPIVEIRRTTSEEVSLKDLAIDFAFIDGSHTYEGVRNDIEKVLANASPDAVLAFHDYSEDGFPGVVRAVDEFRAGHQPHVVGVAEATIALRLRS